MMSSCWEQEAGGYIAAIRQPVGIKDSDYRKILERRGLNVSCIPSKALPKRGTGASSSMRPDIWHQSQQDGEFTTMRPINAAAR
jgi:hypothetical protein